MGHLSTLTTQSIKIPLQGTNKRAIIEELTQHCWTLDEFTAPPAAYQSIVQTILAREEQGTTGLGGGVAIPHARQSEIQGLHLVIGVAPHGVDFDCLDRQLAYVIILILTGQNGAMAHIEALSEIASLAGKPDFIPQAQQCTNPEEVLKLFYAHQ
ncbi:MAG: PTS sugar transporter subunit IIA [Spirochaetales bacterium]|nr:PTS sugar transporter subunit IIA [Spirochaetales bacterium]